MFNILMRVFSWAITFGLGSFLFKVGVALFVFVGLDLIITEALGVLQGYISGIPADILSILELMGFSTGLSIMASAMVTAVALKTAMNKVNLGSIKA